MTPAARLQASIELLDEIIIAARDNGPAADTIARGFFSKRRYAGSKDRRAVRDLVWEAIRRFGERPETARTAFAAMADDDADLVGLFDGSSYGPALLDEREPRAISGLLPRWLSDQFPKLVNDAEQAALLERAPLDVRVNTAKLATADVLAVIPEAVAVTGAPDLIRLPTGFALEQHRLYLDGSLEIQDMGSQLIAAACAAQPGMTVLDLCAGAGGKTLALAAAMGGSGRLVASDTNRNRLSQLQPRAERAGVSALIETLLLDPGKETEQLGDLVQQCDVVLVDAPCSGSGTWRRNPETRWRLTEDRLKRVVAQQSRILDLAAPLVKPGGALVYAVCSLLEKEGAAQIEAFLKRQQGWQSQEILGRHGRALGDGKLLTPLHDGSDGFFVARLLRLC